MRINKQKQNEMLVKFNQVTTPQELDEEIYLFEKKMNEQAYNYFLKESENPFIFILEYPKPDELIKEIEIRDDLKNIVELVPVECVQSNINYITSAIIRKIKHKVAYDDTFNVTYHIYSFSVTFDRIKLEKNLKTNIEELINIPVNNKNPMWDIHVYLLGELSAVNIIRSKRNRNKYSQYNN
ncbi:hypothetical protein OTK55_03250 [Methanosphaera sp. Vir-13MRS]|uniref:THUMP domain-containing protein n=1 Tax=Candidatus Methanosphaera massiliense TaxID=3017187 RepID=UPI0023803369|nr:THUMP domain-containing protein [Candidatus Methanosphaera massiliense]MDD6285719.1 hypothetical protein [Methanobacteriaceae archaeon]MDE4078035.1 hypothetical protein [Candidatus Methanosphaera massiliense]MDY2745010.1 hypothetical protein [Methanosphaera sp.]